MSNNANSCERRSITIPTFFSPNLFWFINVDESQARKKLIDKLQSLQSRFKLCEEPKINQIVAIRIDKKWVRAQVKGIREQNGINYIIVVLCDDGICKRVSKVFELPRDITGVPPFAKKGMVYGIQSTKAHLDYAGSTHIYPCESWSSGSINKIQKLLNEPVISVHFVEKLTFNDTIVGDLFITPQGQPTINVAEYLVKLGCAIFNEVAFKLELLSDTGTEAILEIIVKKLQEIKHTNMSVENSETCQEFINKAMQSTAGRAVGKPLCRSLSTEDLISEISNDSLKFKKDRTNLDESSSSHDDERKSNLKGNNYSTERNAIKLRSKSEVRFKEPLATEIPETENYPQKSTRDAKRDFMRQIQKERERILQKAGYTQKKTYRNYRDGRKNFDSNEKSGQETRQDEKNQQTFRNNDFREMTNQQSSNRSFRGRGSFRKYENLNSSSEVSSCASFDQFEDAENDTDNLNEKKNVPRMSRGRGSVKRDRKDVHEPEKDVSEPSKFSAKSFGTCGRGFSQRSRRSISSISDSDTSFKLNTSESPETIDKNTNLTQRRTYSDRNQKSNDGSETDSIKDTPGHKFRHSRRSSYTKNKDVNKATDLLSDIRKFDDADADFNPVAEKPLTLNRTVKNERRSTGRGFSHSARRSNYDKFNNTETTASTSKQMKSFDDNEKFDLSSQMSTCSEISNPDTPRPSKLMQALKRITVLENQLKEREKRSSLTAETSSDFNLTETSNIDTISCGSENSISDNSKQLSVSEYESPLTAARDESYISPTKQTTSTESELDMSREKEVSKCSFLSDYTFSPVRGRGKSNIVNKCNMLSPVKPLNTELRGMESLFSSLKVNKSRVYDWMPAGTSLNPEIILKSPRNENYSKNTSIVPRNRPVYNIVREVTVSGDNQDVKTYFSPQKIKADNSDRKNDAPEKDIISQRDDKKENSGNKNSFLDKRNRIPDRDVGGNDFSKLENFNNEEDPPNIICQSKNCNNGEELINPKAGHCQCDVCVSWTETNGPVFRNPIVKKPIYSQTYQKKIIHKPQLLLKTSTQNKIVITKKICYKNLFDKFIAPKVLFHGIAIPEPVLALNEAKFHPFIYEALKKLNYQKSHRIQAYTWPCIIRNQNTIIVNGKGTGKTLAYVPPVCSGLLLVESDELLDSLKGPLALIIVPGVLVGENVSTLMCKLYQSTRDKPKICLAVPPLVSRIKNEISKGVDVLICTPQILIKLVKEKETKLKRVCWFVLECADELFEKFPEEIETILQMLQNTLIKRTFMNSVQLIAVAEHWTPPIEKLVKRLEVTPNVCIGSFIEAALYGRVGIQIKFIKSYRKRVLLEDILEPRKKTVVVCNTTEEIDEVCVHLEMMKPARLDNESNADDWTRVQQWWTLGSKQEYTVLVCTDLVLNSSCFVQISDAEIVVQYSLPATWTLFSQRFSLFLDNYCSLLGKQNDDDARCKMYTFVDENSWEQLGKMVKLLKRVGVDLPSDIVQVYKSSINAKENERLHQKKSLCNNLKLFGTCLDRDNCKKRHLLDSELDVSTTIPQSGIIKIKIIHMHDVTSYAARLIEHTDAEGKIHNVTNKFSYVSMKLTRLMREGVRKTVYSVDIGSICVVEESPSLYRRCKVVKIIHTDILNEPNVVEVKILDIGSKKIVPVSELYTLNDDELLEMPPQVVDVYIADMGPPEKDTHWSDCSRIRLLKLLKAVNYTDGNRFFSGRIKLQLGNTLWVNNLTLQEFDVDGSIEVHRFSARSVLLRNDLAEDRPGQLQSLYNLCKQANIILPDYSLPIIKTKKKIPVQKKPEWAHLENFKEYNMVYFSSGLCPGQFFIRLSEHQKSFDDLTDEIQDSIIKPLYPTEFEVVEGNCYLAKDPEGGHYARVLIKRIIDNMAECFFVDHGDFALVEKSELKYLTDELITRLPFQVIECELFGIQPKDNAWNDGALDLLYSYAFEPEFDFLRLLYAKTIDNKPAGLTGGKRYSVILIDSLKAQTIINSVFVDEGFAINVEGENFNQVDFDTWENPTPNFVNNTTSDDTDTDKEYTIEEIQEKKKMHLDIIESTNNQEDKVISQNCTDKLFQNGDLDSEDGSEKVYDLEVNNFIEFIRDGMQKQDTKPFIATSSLTNDEYTAPVLPAPDYSTPLVKWSQTETHVTLKIELPDIKDYDISVARSRIFYFSTFYQSTQYKLQLNLFSKVKSSFKHEARGLYVFVKLEKCIEQEWDRLVCTRQRQRNITYDIDRIKSQKEVKEERCSALAENIFSDDENVLWYGSDVDYDDSSVDSYCSDD